MSRGRFLHWRAIKPIRSVYPTVLTPIYNRIQGKHLLTRVSSPNSTSLPPWAPGYVPEPSNYDTSLLLNCYNPFVRHFIVWQAEVQKQKRKLRNRFKRFLKKRMQLSMENKFVPVGNVEIKTDEPVYSYIAQAEQEPSLFLDSFSGDDDGNVCVNIEQPGCLMTTVDQELLTPAYLPWDCFVGYVDYQVVPAPVLETTNLYTSIYLPPESIMLSAEQEQHIPVEFSRESFPNYDDDHVPSPAHEVVVCDDNYYDTDADYAYQQLREQREIVEEKHRRQIYAWEMPREM